MRRSTIAFLFQLLLPAAAAAQADSAVTPATATAPTFHAGQWAAEFSVSGGFYGLGVERFTSTTAATVLWASTHADYQSSGSAANQKSARLSFTVGRRWYRPAIRRVRPFTGIGIGPDIFWRRQVGGPNRDVTTVYGLRAYGQLGATIFFAPELSLGAYTNASISASQERVSLNGTLFSKQNSYSLDAGNLYLVGAFYF